MPSALETLIKILRLEQETGYKNTAVIGGLESFAPNWQRDAHNQAKTNAQHALTDELCKVMLHYSELSKRDDRQQTVKYMLGRITGRIDPKPEFADRPETDEDPAKDLPPETRMPAIRETQQDIVDEQLEIIDFIEDSEPKPAPVKAPKPRRQVKERPALEDAIALLNELAQPANTLKGVGERRAQQLARLGIETIGDLLFFMPRRYDDYTCMAPLNRLPIGEHVTAIGTVQEVFERYARGNRPYLNYLVTDEAGELQVTFFNQPYMKRQLKPGYQVAFYGKTDLFRGKLSMANPEWELVDQRSLHKGNIVPVYPLTKGLTSKAMRKLTYQASKQWARTIPEYMPDSVLDRTELVELSWAVKQVHSPEKWEYLEYAQERLAFDELIMMQLGVLAKRQMWQSVPGIPLMVSDEWLNEFKATLPYELTNAQSKAVDAIRQDVQQDVPMNRLLQGDVGAGKTAVAATAIGMAVVNAKQAAIMAPTSILAEQHYHSIGKFMRQMPGGETVDIRLLTGSTGAAERSEIYEGLANGSIQVVVGTHALIQETVEFSELAIAIIDEQHRFGVEERGALRGKGMNPHVLVMTATPIPRALALTMFADLDLTVLDEMPPGRKPIETRLLYIKERERASSFVISQLEQGRQGFIVYPLVEASESIESEAAVDAFEALQKSTFRHFKLGLLHGRMKPAEKDAVMAQMAAGDIHLLISTSVIEVGIDVPNATVIMIEGANRFGLAQLHQFRGRVGRGEHQSYCLLISDSDKIEAINRLQKLEETTDGFELAELDWQIRGPGDLLGTRQAGYGAVKMDSAMDPRLVEMAQQESRALFEEDPGLELEHHALLSQRVRQLRDRRTDFS